MVVPAVFVRYSAGGNYVSYRRNFEVSSMEGLVIASSSSTVFSCQGIKATFCGDQLAFSHVAGIQTASNFRISFKFINSSMHFI